MEYSVYNYGTKQYDYYWAPTNVKAHAPKPPTAHGVSSLGATPEQAAWPLPAGAKRTGSGPNPRGRISATKTSGEALSGMFDDSTNLLAIGGVAFLVWRFFLKKG